MTPEQEKNVGLLTAALRSGKYRQCRNRLADGDGHCCLGVLCEVYQENVGDLRISPCPMPGGKTYDGQLCAPPDKVAAWVGFDTRGGVLLDGDSLVHRNDTGTPFSEIADLIESSPPGLFVE